MTGDDQGQHEHYGDRRPSGRQASAARATPAAAACHSSVLGSIAQWAGPAWVQALKQTGAERSA